MAIYHLALLRRGRVEAPYSTEATLIGITIEEGDEVLEIPAEFEGYPVTHIAVKEKIIPAHEHFHDWHHPGQGSEWIPDSYDTSYLTISLNEQIKRVVLPKTARWVHSNSFSHADHVLFEVHPDNPYYQSIDGKIVRK